MGRLWQTLVLSQWNALLTQLPVESMVYQHQANYYAAISQSTAATDSEPFIGFILSMMAKTLDDHLQAQELRVKGSENSTEKSSEKIVAIIKGEPDIAAKSIAEHLGLSSRAIEKQIAQLKRKGLLKRVGPARGGYWDV